MNRMIVSYKELLFLSFFFRTEEIVGLPRKVPIEEFTQKLQNNSEELFSSWEKKGLFRRSNEEDGIFPDPGLVLIMHTITDPASCFVCSCQENQSYVWGVYLKKDIIVFIDHQEEDQFLVCWVPTIPLAFGSMYGKMKDILKQEEQQKKLSDSLKFSFVSGSSNVIKMLSLLGGNKYLLTPETERPEEADQTLSFKEVFDQISLWIAKEHSNCMKEIVEDGRIQY